MRPLLGLALLGLSVSLACAELVRDGALVREKKLGPRRPLEANAEAAVRAARFVVTELQQLSDSGVYETLELRRILDASEQTGVFHENLFLTLELTSPHLADGAEASLHEVIVMKSLDDGVTSFAIDEFPIMDEDAIEEFWIRKVEIQRQERERVLAALEAEARIATGSAPSSGSAREDL